jgi:hypothetical protein
VRSQEVDPSGSMTASVAALWVRAEKHGAEQVAVDLLAPMSRLWTSIPGRVAQVSIDLVVAGFSCRWQWAWADSGAMRR